MRPPSQSNKEFEQVLTTEGSHLLRLFRILDFGTQETNYLGKINHQHKIRLDFEVLDQTHDFGNGEQNLIITKKYTYSYYQSHLLADMESWRGSFKAGETDSNNPNGFDIESMLGKPAMGSIIHKTFDNGDKIALIKSLSPPYKDMEIPELTRSIITLILEKDRFDENIFNSLSEKVQKQIALSPEYQEIVYGTTPEKQPEKQVAPEQEESGFESEGEPPPDDEQIPFP